MSGPDCPSCDDTGWIGPPGSADRTPCTCDGRPFELLVGPPAPQRIADPIQVYRPPGRPMAEAAVELAVGIDLLLSWSEGYLSGLISLSVWWPYLLDGGPVDQPARRALGVLDDVDDLAAELPAVLADLRARAEQVLQGEEVAA